MTLTVESTPLEGVLVIQPPVFRDARAIVRGTDDISIARSLYSRFIGV